MSGISEYEQRAEAALKDVGATVKIRLSDTKKGGWTDDQYHPHYRVKLTGPGGSYTFDYWGSVVDGKTGRHATAYDVLACAEWGTPDTFEDFCSQGGYDTDSREAERTWKACLKMTKALERIFPSQAHRDRLSEIR